jgi:hypothetical protein
MGKASKPQARQNPQARVKKAKASKAQTAARVEDIVQVRLDGAFLFSQIREYVIGQSKEEGSPWHRPNGAELLSDVQLRRLVRQADEIIHETFDRKRRRHFTRHLAQRRNLYARAVTSGELSTALAILKDEADLLGFYTQKIEHSGRLEVVPVERMSDEELIKIATAGLPARSAKAQ